MHTPRTRVSHFMRYYHVTCRHVVCHVACLASSLFLLCI
jgi:hypothetical protein